MHNQRLWFSPCRLTAQNGSTAHVITYQFLSPFLITVQPSSVFLSILKDEWTRSCCWSFSYATIYKGKFARREYRRFKGSTTRGATVWIFTPFRAPRRPNGRMTTRWGTIEMAKILTRVIALPGPGRLLSEPTVCCNLYGILRKQFLLLIVCRSGF